MSIDWNKSDRTPFPSVTGCLCGLSIPSVLTHLRSQPEGSLSTGALAYACGWSGSVNLPTSLTHIGDIWVVLHGERRNSPREWAPGARSGHLLAHPLFMGGFCPVFTVTSPFFLLLGSSSVEALVWGLLLGKTNLRQPLGMNLLGVHFWHLFFPPLSLTTPLSLMYLIPAVYTHSGRC